MRGNRRRRSIANDGGNNLTDSGAGPLAREMEAVKRLLLLLLVKVGANSEELGWALRVTGRRVRQLVPTAGIKKLVLPGQPKE